MAKTTKRTQLPEGWVEAIPNPQREAAAIRREEDSAKRAEVAEQAFSDLQHLHASRVRLCSMTYDAQALTSTLRRVHPSIKAEFDGTKIVVYAYKALSEGDVKAVVALMMPVVDMT